MLVRVSDYQAHTRNCRQFSRRALRVAARYQYLRPRIFAVNTADRGPRVLIGRSGYRAGVEDDDFGFARAIGAQQSALEQLALDGRAVGLGRAASEILYMVRRHNDDYTDHLAGILRAWAVRVRITPTQQPLTAGKQQLCCGVLKSKSLVAHEGRPLEFP